MRILHCIHSLDPRGGGPAQGIQLLGECNQAHGHSVEIASLDPAEAHYLSSIPFKVYPLGQREPRYGFSTKYVPWLRQNAKHYSAVIVNGIWQFNSFGAWWVLAKSDPPYFVFTHGMLDPWFKRTYPLKHIKKWLYWPWAEYRVLRDARAVLFTCEEERRLARQSFWLYKCKEQVVSYGTAEPPGNANKQRAGFFAKYPQLQGKRIILYLGRIHVKKGVEELLKAFAAQATNSPFVLAMIGPCVSPTYLENIKTLSEKIPPEKLLLVPEHISGDLKWGAFRVADAFILPSHQENFGIAVTEALSCGVPALISDKVNIWVEIENAQAGLVAEDSVAGISRLLDKWATISPDARTKIAKNARKCFVEKFEANHAAEKLIEVLRENGVKD